MQEITSAHNPVVLNLKALKDKAGRAEQGALLIEGEKLMDEALSCGLRPREALIDAEKLDKYAALSAKLEAAGARVYAVPGRIIETASDTRTPQGALGSFSTPAALDIERAPKLLVALDGVQDPGNAGTILRTADAAGFGGMLLSAECPDPFSPKFQRAAMGSLFRLPVWRGDLAGALAKLRGEGRAIVVSSLDGAPAMRGKIDACVLVVGSEARGVSDEALALADERLKLPMRGGAESLNAAVAAGIMLYALAERAFGE